LTKFAYNLLAAAETVLTCPSLSLGMCIAKHELTSSSFYLELRVLYLLESSDHLYFVHPSTDISVDISTDVSANISTDTRPICWSTYLHVLTLGRYIACSADIPVFNPRFSEASLYKPSVVSRTKSNPKKTMEPDPKKTIKLNRTRSVGFFSIGSDWIFFEY